MCSIKNIAPFGTLKKILERGEGFLLKYGKRGKK